MATISRQEYNNLFGPTVGDKIRLGDTDLYVEIEKDLREYGDEVVYGGGKTIRDGMGLANTMTSEEGALDLVITNVTIIDANLGVVKADVGVKDGKIAGIGKAGNPNIMHGVHPDLVTSTATDAISGEHLILTAAGIDGHVHMISPQQAYACLSNGITTLFGGGIGPTDGSNGTTITSGRWNIERMLESIEGLPVNVGLLGKGNCSMNQPLEEQIEAGACGLKIHEDWGSTPAAIRAALGVADRFDVQVAIHSDTLNESGYVEDTIAAMDGRTIHTYHTEGAGGGHAPDLLKVASMPYVLPSSTNPTLPFGVNSQAELFDMIMVCHNLNPKIPSDVAFAESRVRPETQAAENVLHDLGILSMVSSDSQAMGRIGESFMRTFQMASFMKNACGKLAEDADGNDNFRVLRYIAKGKEEGARVLCGGDVLKGDGFDNGAWVAPTVFTDCSDDMTIVREEIFGPVMSILTYESEDEVIRRANDTDYGLAAGIVTADLNRAHRVIHQLEAGICWINTWGESPAEMPVGGYKHSGIGRENGVMTLQSYTQVKSIQVEMAKFQSIF